MAVRPLPHRFTVAEYHQMAVGGVFSEDDRVELIDGEVLEKTPIGSRHAGCVNRLNRLLVGAVGERAVVSVQNPVQVGDWSEPQPDIAVLRPRPDFYSDGHAQPADVLLLVEVADTSGPYDRGVKVPLYLAGGIPEVWVVDLPGDAVEVFRASGSVTLRPGDTAAVGTHDGIVVEVAVILR